MILSGFRWLELHLRPAQGWLPLLLLFATVLVLTMAVVDVDWVPQGPVVFLTGFLGLSFGGFLAARPTEGRPRFRAILSWALICAYGLVVTVTWLGQLVPPLPLLFAGWPSSSEYIRQNWALFVDRVGGWSAVVLQGGRSEETIVFALGLGLLAWLLTAFTAWSIFRWRRPWAGLALLTLALACNSYFGRAEIWTLPVFTGLMVALAAIVHYADREEHWSRKEMDYSTEIRLELLAYIGVVSLVLLLATAALPAINIRAISRAVRNQPAVAQAEETLQRVFAGVRQPGNAAAAGEQALEAGGAQGTLPRAFLLGAPPELYETVVMTATVQGESSRATHWRGLSYDIYTGHGWAVSAESRKPIVAGQSIPLPIVSAISPLTQTVHWLAGPTVNRYTLGLPSHFAQPVTTYWRGQNDLSRVIGQDVSYTAVSQVSAATAPELRQSILDDVPPAILARYTALPDSVPPRVHDLARQVAGDPARAATPYDQAKALERFLRQYPYSLEVELPPATGDPVDFFLFDQQTGYCDYYASAMVVLARSLGLPARLAAGYLAQQANDGRQTIMEINAHSWTEVYFADYGWLEFEPTAAFPAESAPPPVPGQPGFSDQESATIVSPLPIPTPIADYDAYFWLLLFVPLVIIAAWFWYSRHHVRERPTDRSLWAYERLQRRASHLGQAPRPSQTPAEFTEDFLVLLRGLTQGRLGRHLDPVRLAPDIRRLTTTFADRRYARRKPPPGSAVESWNRIRWHLWLLTVAQDLRRLWPFGR